MKNIGLWIVLVLAVVLGAWVWMETSDTTEDQEVQEMVLNETEDRVEDEEDVAPQEAVCTPSDAKVVVVSNDDMTSHTVMVNGTAVGTLRASDNEWTESAAEVWRQTDCYTFIDFSPTGLGGAIYYGGPFRLYVVDKAEGTMRSIPTEGFVADISPDGQWVAARAEFDGKQSVVGVQIVGTAAGSVAQLIAPPDDSGFDDGISAKFSPDGTKLAYTVAARWSCVEGDGVDVCDVGAYIIDLDTGLQTELEISSTIRDGYPVYVSGWSDNNTPMITDEM